MISHVQEPESAAVSTNNPQRQGYVLNRFPPWCNPMLDRSIHSKINARGKPSAWDLHYINVQMRFNIIWILWYSSRCLNALWYSWMYKLCYSFVDNIYNCCTVWKFRCVCKRIKNLFQKIGSKKKKKKRFKCLSHL